VHILLIFGQTWMLPPTYAWHLALDWPAALAATMLVIVASVAAGAALAWLDRDRHPFYVRLRLAGAVLLAYVLWYGPPWI
jgi:hypothetical protein